MDSRVEEELDVLVEEGHLEAGNSINASDKYFFIKLLIIFYTYISTFNVTVKRVYSTYYHNGHERLFKMFHCDYK